MRIAKHSIPSAFGPPTSDLPGLFVLQEAILLGCKDQMNIISLEIWMEMQIICVDNDLHMSLAATNGILKGRFNKACLGALRT